MTGSILRHDFVAAAKYDLSAEQFTGKSKFCVKKKEIPWYFLSILENCSDVGDNSLKHTFSESRLNISSDKNMPMHVSHSNLTQTH